MFQNYWLSEEEFNKLKPLLPYKSRGVARVDDRRVLSEIIFCLQRGYRWSDVPAEYSPAKTLYNRYKRWSEAGIFADIFEQDMDTSTLMIDASHIKTHRVTANGVKKTVLKCLFSSQIYRKYNLVSVDVQDQKTSFPFHPLQ